ncbi:hypothetical protein [Serratia marcescens]|uniref:hypothetical protein n=1 Tax=Serratia marcescens TaxID=615 RepID=UPI001EFF28CB|nr:hypothetical protein [Serratia marcescens]ELY1862139.1 hypothetical protein [Serratia marcescens]
MNKEKIVITPSNRQLFDGNEEQFRLFKKEVSIPNSNEKVLYDNSSAIPIWDIDEDIRKTIAEKISEIKVIEYPHDPIPSYKNENLDIYVQPVESESHRNRITIITAAGESQPARYKIKLLGFILR